MEEDKKPNIVGGDDMECPKCGNVYKADFGCINQNCELYSKPQRTLNEPVGKPATSYDMNGGEKKEQKLPPPEKMIKTDKSEKSDYNCPKCGQLYKWGAGCQNKQCKFIEDRDKPSGWANGHPLNKADINRPPDMGNIR